MFTVQVSSAKFCSVSLLLLLLKFIFLGGFDTEFDYNEVFVSGFLPPLSYNPNSTGT